MVQIAQKRLFHRLTQCATGTAEALADHLLVRLEGKRRAQRIGRLVKIHQGPPDVHLFIGAVQAELEAPLAQVIERHQQPPARHTNRSQRRIGVARGQRIRLAPALPAVFGAAGQHPVERLAGIAQQGHGALPIQRHHGGLQGIVATADAKLVDHFAVGAQVQVFGKLAEKLMIDRQADRTVGMKHRRAAHQRTDVQKRRRHQLPRR